MKQAILRRLEDTGKQTTGRLVVRGLFSCVTMELPYKGNQKSISCIPKGEYVCKWTYSPLFMKYTYEVTKVPNRSGIRLHRGNYFFNFLGCIGLGVIFTDLNKDGQRDITETTKTVENFNKLMNKENFLLIIQ